MLSGVPVLWLPLEESQRDKVSTKLLGEYLYQINKEACLSWTVEECPAQEKCPIKMDIEGYIAAIAKRRFKEALDIIREVTPFPATLGRICAHPCEEKCKRSKIEEAISVRALKRFIADYELRSIVDKVTPYPRTREKKVAVIGSGPAGLTAAIDLVKQGYGVTVFEASPIAGGMMAKAIPDFILPKEVVAMEVECIRESGVEIKTNTVVGRDLMIDDLFEQGYKAIFIATGMPKSLNLKLPGIDSAGIFTALPLLESARLGKKEKLGDKIVVIGGGNVAIDVARMAIRWGVKEVNITCLESRAEMPAFEWEIERAEAEGVKIHCSLAPQRFISKEGKVSGIVFRRVERVWFDSEGRIRWSLEEGPGTESMMDSDNVVVAIGQTTDLSYLSNSRLEISKRGTIVVDPETLATNKAGIFAGGDMTWGLGTAVDAMADGHKAAISIVQYLNGEYMNKSFSPDIKKITITGEDRIPKDVTPRRRQSIPVIPVGRANRNFEEVEMGFTEEQAVAEAERCLECKTCNRCIKNYRCIAMIWQPNELLARRSPQIDLDICVGCGICPQICLYETILPKESIK